MTPLNYVKFLRQDAVNDIFSYINCEGKTEYLKFPRTMGMNTKDVDNYLSE